MSAKQKNILIPTALILLSLIPFLGGVVRLMGLINGEAVTPDNARFVAVPLPVILHIITAVPFSILGAFQFAPGFRRSNSTWHRLSGRLLVLCGLTTAITGLWMAQFYTFTSYMQNDVLYGLRVVFGLGMIVSLILGTRAIVHRDFAQHSAWMIRGYAIGQGAGTQALVTIPWIIMLGNPDETIRTVLMGAGWVINVVFAEWIIRRKPAYPNRKPVMG
jgi:uncharacterized membrane protein